MKAISIIPARYSSTRFPGKPLADIAGKTLIERVYLQVKRAEKLSDVFVATDDRRIFDEVSRFGGNAIMTSNAHPSGTDRIAEAARDVDCDLIVNVQGDEPLIPPELIDNLVSFFETEPDLKTVTAAHVITDPRLIKSSDVVKVTLDDNFFAVNFSRSPIPAFTGKQKGEKGIFPEGPGYFKHIGIYAFTRETLFEFIRLQPTVREIAEKLEQLRLIENGIKLKTVITDYKPVGVDTPEDVRKVLEALRS